MSGLTESGDKTQRIQCCFSGMLQNRSRLVWHNCFPKKSILELFVSTLTSKCLEWLGELWSNIFLEILITQYYYTSLSPSVVKDRLLDVLHDSHHLWQLHTDLSSYNWIQILDIQYIFTKRETTGNIYLNYLGEENKQVTKLWFWLGSNVRKWWEKIFISIVSDDL